MAVVDYMTRAVITVVALVYPGYLSFKAIKTADVVVQQALLKYWLVLSVLSGLMLVIEPIAYDRVPLWSLIKIGAVVFLVLPKTKGYEKVYQMVLQPQLERYEVHIDAACDKIVKAGEEQARNVRPQLEGLVAQGRDFAKKTLNKKAS